MLGALAAALAVGGSVAMARGDCGWGKEGKGQWTPERAELMQERMSTRVEQQLARVELALALQPEQRGAWESFQRDVLAGVGNMTGQMAERANENRPASAPERLAAREQGAEARLQVMRQTRAAVTTFYDSLGDAQKKVFDAEFGRLMAKGGKGAQSGKAWHGEGRSQ